MVKDGDTSGSDFLFSGDKTFLIKCVSMNILGAELGYLGGRVG